MAMEGGAEVEVLEVSGGFEDERKREVVRRMSSAAEGREESGGGGREVGCHKAAEHGVVD